MFVCKIVNFATFTTVFQPESKCLFLKGVKFRLLWGLYWILLLVWLVVLKSLMALFFYLRLFPYHI